MRLYHARISRAMAGTRRDFGSYGLGVVDYNCNSLYLQRGYQL
jgi:hypothetical protein